MRYYGMIGMAGLLLTGGCGPKTHAPAGTEGAAQSPASADGGAPAASAERTVRYTVTDLGTLGRPNGTSVAWAINASGQVAGTATTQADNVDHAFLWTPDAANGPTGRMTDLGALGSQAAASHSEARGLSDDGIVVGASETGEPGVLHACFWQNGQPPSDLGLLGGNYAKANGLNSRGQVVGVSSLADGSRHACLWSGGRAMDLGTLGGAESVAFAVGDDGTVVGQAALPSGAVHACLWRGGAAQDLGDLGGGSSTAHALTASGQAVGSAMLPGGGGHACLWNGSAATDLGALEDKTSSEARAMNRQGQAVGRITRGQGITPLNGGTPLYSERAALWSEGQVYDLNRLIPADSGWVLGDAKAINDRGQIVGSGAHNGNHAFLLTPVGS